MPRAPPRSLRIAEDDGVGLVCAFSTLEPCRSFTVAGNRETKRLEVVRRPRQCRHFSWYLIDPEFGWMHVRLQSWAPYSIYVNGREWLARQLDRRGIAYSKSDNKITWVVEAARQLCDSLTHTAWPSFLDRLALMVNPLLPDLQKFGAYWWVIDQCEDATDLLFKERGVLETVRDDLVAMTGFGAVLRFLDRKPHPAFTGAYVNELGSWKFCMANPRLSPLDCAERAWLDGSPYERRYPATRHRS